jgi:hypothetical protein
MMMKNKMNSSKGSQGKQGNAQWSSMDMSSSQSSLGGSALNLDFNPNGSSSAGLGAFNLLSQKLTERRIKTTGMTSASTSALSNLPYESYRKHSVSKLLGLACDVLTEEDDPALSTPPQTSSPKKLQLRQETLMSLGIKTKPKGCMKSTASGGMRRATTLCSLRETEITLSTGETIKRNVSITFNEKVRAKSIPSANDFTDADKKEMWFQDDEMRVIRRSNKDLVAMVEDTPPEKTDSMEELRGLERLLPGNRTTIKNRKMNTWDSVLDTQDSQRWTGKYDDEQIATMVRAMSNASMREAQRRAQHDATAVQ